ncbi:hypothetical protein UCRPA7_1410 [Phaeoacremonium minimum UCRPA7]|uniref:Uncharacterized protein n=1 Tax=Phaeoacremonium minimum (strain UCR-PA7) TaxID=1286976 RepID=R8BUP4_PHAM7|nr:hypothetical protein UCRPA7_1410 [Phaeoacremonium minimum UCRPA7]EOO03082.1 hypothetical protein UCRPA7_1410 [Phaeoacremonium minimum UCRPA7]
MSRLLFTRRPARLLPEHDDEDPASAYSSLLDQDDPAVAEHQAAAAAAAAASAFPQRSQSLRYQHRRTKSSPKVYTAAAQTAVIRRQPSWTGERPVRKLIKEPTAGSARPSFSVEISDGDGDGDGGAQGKEKGKAGSGTVRRSILRLRDYWKGEK